MQRTLALRPTLLQLRFAGIQQIICRPTASISDVVPRPRSTVRCLRGSGWWRQVKPISLSGNNVLGSFVSVRTSRSSSKLKWKLLDRIRKAALLIYSIVR